MAREDVGRCRGASRYGPVPRTGRDNEKTGPGFKPGRMKYRRRLDRVRAKLPLLKRFDIEKTKVFCHDPGTQGHKFALTKRPGRLEMTDKSGSDGSNTGSSVPVGAQTAEAKRLAARRRFLLGGASTLPLVMTLGQKEAWAASAQVCQSLNMEYDREYVWRRAKEKYIEKYGAGAKDDPDLSELRGLAASLYCDPSKRWS